MATVRRGWPAAGAPRAFGLLARKRFPADAGAREQHGEGTTLLSTQHAARSRAASQMIVLLTVLSEKKAIVVTRGVLLMPLAHAPVPQFARSPTRILEAPMLVAALRSCLFPKLLAARLWMPACYQSTSHTAQCENPLGWRWREAQAGYRLTVA